MNLWYDESTRSSVPYNNMSNILVLLPWYDKRWKSFYDLAGISDQTTTLQIVLLIRS